MWTPWDEPESTFYVVACTGTLQRDFKHLAVDMYLFEEDGEKKLKVEAHFGKRKALASIRTACSHVEVGTAALCSQL